MPRHVPDRVVIAVLTLVTAVVYFSSSVGVMNSMDAPQYALTRAIVEKQTFRIGDYKWISPDFAVVDGEIYTKRSPGVSFLAVPFHAYSLALGDHLRAPYFWEPHDGIDADSPLEAMTYGLVSLAAVAAVVLLYAILRQLQVRAWAAAAAALLLAFGTLLWEYSASFVREPAGIMFLFAAYLALLKLRETPRPWYAAVAGASLSLAVFCDSTAALVAAVLGAYAVYLLARARAWRQPAAALALAVGLGVGLLPLVAYNLAVFQRPFAVPQQYDQNLFWRDASIYFLSNPIYAVPANLVANGPVPVEAVPYLRDYPEVAKANGAERLVQGPYKGVLTQSPVLWLAFPMATVLLWRNAQCLVPTLAFLAVLVTLSRYTGFYNANNFDTRYFLPGVAFLYIPLGLVLDLLTRGERTWLHRGVLAAVLLVAVGSVVQGWDALLHNYSPHASTEGRGWLPLQQPGLDLPERVRFTLGVTFPNFGNLPYLVPVLVPWLALLLWGDRLKGPLRLARERLVPSPSAQ